jgi:predicted RNA-binding protein YlxR (DUF448 family)
MAAAILEPAKGPRPHAPERRCIATGISEPAGTLIRFVVSPDGEILPDLAERLPGRGIWVKADRAALETACRKRLFRRTAGASVIVPDDLIIRIEAGLLRRCIDLLGLARRAGEAVFGFEKAREWLATGRAGLLLAAADGDARDRARLRGLAAEVPVIEALTADELGRATGRPRSVHGVVARGRLAASLLRETARLAGVRAMNAGIGENGASGTDRIKVTR